MRIECIKLNLSFVVRTVSEVEHNLESLANDLGDISNLDIPAVGSLAAHLPRGVNQEVLTHDVGVDSLRGLIHVLVRSQEGIDELVAHDSPEQETQ